MHGTTCVYFGVITHVWGGESLARKVGKPITELVVTLRCEPPLLAVEGVTDGKFHSTFIAIVRQVRWIDVVAQEDRIPPLLNPYLCTIFGGGEHQ